MYVEAVFCQVLSLSCAPLVTSSYIELLEVVLLAEQSTDFCHGSDSEDSFQGQVRGVVGGTAVINGQPTIMHQPTAFVDDTNATY